MNFDPNALRYNDQGLIPCIAQDFETHQVLMMAWMNKASIEKSLETSEVTYWSRSRQEFWVKGATSGHTQELVSLRLDCDADCLLAIVKQKGSACHTGKRSCFYTEIKNGHLEDVSPF